MVGGETPSRPGLLQWRVHSKLHSGSRLHLEDSRELRRVLSKVVTSSDLHLKRTSLSSLRIDGRGSSSASPHSLYTGLGGDVRACMVM